MDSEIIRDVVCNYLTLAGEESKSAGYEIKMFKGKKVPGFLEMLVRSKNGKNVYQYKIFNYDSMKERYSKEGIQLKDIRRLFGKIIEINTTVSEFLLNIDCVVLNPEYIYVDGEELFFCYYPGEEYSFGEGLKRLMEYVLEHIDHNDRSTVMTAYGLYQRILKNSYTLESLMEVFEEKIQDTAPPVQYVSEENPPECVRDSDVYRYEMMTEGESGRGIFERIKNIFHKKKKEEEEYTAEGGTMLLSANKLMGLNGEEPIILTHFPFVIGSRAKNCDYVINSPMVSRKHAVIWCEKGSYYVEDVGSTNGTKINDVKIQSCEKVSVSPGDIVEFANVKYRFE